MVLHPPKVSTAFAGSNLDNR